MTEELALRRKYTMRAHGKQMVFIKKSLESRIHVLTKAFLWALYLPDYPDLAVEVPVGGRYKPDLVQFDVKGLLFSGVRRDRLDSKNCVPWSIDLDRPIWFLQSGTRTWSQCAGS